MLLWPAMSMILYSWTMSISISLSGVRKTEFPLRIGVGTDKPLRLSNSYTSDSGKPTIVFLSLSFQVTVRLLFLLFITVRALERDIDTLQKVSMETLSDNGVMRHVLESTSIPSLESVPVFAFPESSMPSPLSSF